MKGGYQLYPHEGASCDAIYKWQKFASGSCKTNSVSNCLSGSAENVGDCDCV